MNKTPSSHEGIKLTDEIEESSQPKLWHQTSWDISKAIGSYFKEIEAYSCHTSSTPIKLKL